MTYLLEPNFERAIQDRDERNRLLTRTLRNRKEIRDILHMNEGPSSVGRWEPQPIICKLV